MHHFGTWIKFAFEGSAAVITLAVAMWILTAILFYTLMMLDAREQPDSDRAEDQQENQIPFSIEPLEVEPVEAQSKGDNAWNIW